MSLAIVFSRGVAGINAPLVTIEAHISQGLPAFTLVGLPEKTVKEARERVRSAIINSGYNFPVKRITVSLAPADMPKEGGRYDLPIAIAILVASAQLSLDEKRLSTYEFSAELSLSGKLNPIQGVIPAIQGAIIDQRQMIIPSENQLEATLIQPTHCLLADNLKQVCEFLQSGQPLCSPDIQPSAPAISSQTSLNLNEVIGQQQAKRALEITAAGGHNLLMLGSPGTGKTMLAHRLPTILPPLTTEQAMEVAALNSLCQLSQRTKDLKLPPFRAPHHGATVPSLIGGGAIPIPGEISLAHHGVLFLDELPEFNRSVLDALRQPLESGEISIARTKMKITFPANFQLIAAMNPSPTGHYQGKENRSSPNQILRYLNRLSGPFLDRFDLSIELTSLPQGTFNQSLSKVSESSSDVLKRVVEARLIQHSRQGKVNARLNSQEIKQICKLSHADAQWLEKTLKELRLSIRSWLRILKVSRTIADLKGCLQITRTELLEALTYRAMDRLLVFIQEMI